MIDDGRLSPSECFVIFFFSYYILPFFAFVSLPLSKKQSLLGA